MHVYVLMLMSMIGSVIIHVMTPQMRNFYKLEKRWKDAHVRSFITLAYY